MMFPPAIRVVDLPLATAEGLRLRASPSLLVPSGVSINWSAPCSALWGAGKPALLGGTHEVTLAASGRKAGALATPSISLHVTCKMDWDFFAVWMLFGNSFLSILAVYLGPN